MFQMKTFRTKAAMTLLGTILVPILLLAYNGYSSINAIRQVSQDKLLIDHLSLGYKSFDTWFCEQLSELLLFADTPPNVMEEQIKSKKLSFFSLKKEKTYQIFLDEKNTFEFFDYQKTPCFIYTLPNLKAVWIGVENKESGLYYVKSIPIKLFHDKLAAISFKYPYAQFFEVNGRVLFQTHQDLRIDLSRFSESKSVLMKRMENEERYAYYRERSTKGPFGAGSIENYQMYIEELNQLSKLFNVYTGILIIISVISIILISRRIKLPIKKLESAVDKIVNDEFSARIVVSEDDDFKDLYELFNRMVDLDRDHIYRLRHAREEYTNQNAKLEKMNLTLSTNLSKLEETHAKLYHADHQIEMLLASIKDPVFRIDKYGHLLYANDALKTLMGWENGNFPEHVFEFVEMRDPKFSFKSLSFLKGDYRNKIMYFKQADDLLTDEYSMNTQRIYEGNEVVAVQAICKTAQNVDIVQEKLDKRNKELNFLREINEILSSNSNINELMQIVSQKIDSLIGTTICTIRLLNDSGALTLKSASGQFRHLVRRSDVFPDQDPSGRALSENRIIVIRDVAAQQFFNAHELTQLLKRIQDVVFIPLVNEGRQIGVISVGLSRFVKESDIQLLDIFSHQAAIAIDKANLHEKLKMEYLNTIKALATAVEAKDEYTEGHSIRVSKLSCLIARYMGIRGELLDDIEISGLLHDIGKIGIGDAILTKPGHLSSEEFDQIKRHPSIGNKIVQPIGLSQSIIDGILYHHKRFDLNGYPENEHLDALPLVSSIIGVADAFDAMTSNRSYTKKKTIEDAIEEIRLHKGTQFCPVVVDALEKIKMHAMETLKNILITG